MSIANIWRIFRNRVLEQGIIGLVQLTARVQTKAHRRRYVTEEEPFETHR